MGKANGEKDCTSEGCRLGKAKLRTNWPNRDEKRERSVIMTARNAAQLTAAPSAAVKA